MEEIIDYLKTNPKASTADLRHRFGLSKARAFSIRKELGVTSHGWISPEVRQQIEERLRQNPAVKPSILIREFGITAMVLKRIRKRLGLLNASVEERSLRLQSAKSYLIAHPDTRTLEVAKMFDLKEVNIQDIRQELGLPQLTASLANQQFAAKKRAAGLVRREDLPALSGVKSPAKVDTKRERWRKLLAPLDLYSVSSYGRIRNDKTDQLIAQRQTTRGYWMVTLYNGSRSFNRRTHRLVAECFIPNPENKPEVNHMDGDTSNPRLSNLEWVTKAENMLHAVKTGLLSNNTKITSLKAKQLCEALSRRYDEGKSLTQVAEEHNVPHTLLERISSRKTWTTISCDYEW
jgi:hypothetical protein